MNEIDLKLLWQSASVSLETNIAITQKNTEDITRMKAQNFLSSMKPIKIFTLVAGILWVVPLCFVLANLFIYAYDKISLFFLYSAAIQALLTIITIAIYVYQLDLINRIDFSEPVLVIQEKLAKLKISTLRVTRLLFLQLPVWTTFYLSESIFKNGNVSLLIVQGLVTLSFAFVAIWLFINIKYENRNKKWFKWIFGGKEWQPILHSMELIDQIKEYKEQK
jgi:hypothetical protein